MEIVSYENEDIENEHACTRRGIETGREDILSKEEKRIENKLHIKNNVNNGKIR